MIMMIMMVMMMMVVMVDGDGGYVRMELKASAI